MKSFFKGIWSRTKDKAITRDLDHPRDLNLGDMVQLSDSFALPPRLRDQVFKVIGVNTYQFEHAFSTCFTLQGKNDDELDLTIEQSGGRDKASFTLGIDRSVVEQVFDMDQFAEIFEANSSLNLEPSKKAIETLDIAPWLADCYHLEESGERGFYYEKDCRGVGPSEYEGDGEPFDFFSVKSKDGTKGLEIEVYEGGETEVCLVLYRSINDIKELWPAA